MKEMPEMVDCFDEGAWYTLVDYVMVYNKDNVCFAIKNGMEIKA